MIVDFHTHLRVGQGSAADLIAAMDRHGVDRAVVHAIEPAMEGIGSADTAWVAEQSSRHPDRLIAFAGVPPTEPGAPERLRHAVETLGCRGLKLHPPVQGFAFDDPRAHDLLSAAESMAVPVLVHTGPIFVRQARVRPEDVVGLDDWALRHPELVIVLAHADPLGGASVLAGKHRNVYIDTAVVMPRLAELMPGLVASTARWLSTGGQDGFGKILLGSDANPLKPERLADAMRCIRSAGLSPEQEAAMLGGTARRILDLA